MSVTGRGWLEDVEPMVVFIPRDCVNFTSVDLDHLRGAG